MSRLIDADALRKEHCKGCSADIQEFCKDDPVCASLMWLNEAPTIDAVPVVRCKDCKHWGGRHGMDECSLITTITEPTYWAKTQPDDFCSSGERRSE